MTNIKNWKGVFYGIAYGLVSRAIFALEQYGNANIPSVFHTYGMMTVAFMFLVPFAIGLITAYHRDTVTSSRKIAAISMPIFAVLGLIGISVLAGKEGIICALMALPVFLFMSLLGGLIGINIFKRNRSKLYISCLVLLPFVIAPIENQLGLKEKIFSAHTKIEIHANENEVWNHITRVSEISEAENNYSFFQFMGFPRPIKAELDTVAVGGIRKAVFARGLFFTETVTRMQPRKLLAFNIEADPKSIPPRALDEHVMVGGKYFDVLEGKYEIEKLDNQNIMLHLTSRFRLSTLFNFYTGLWSRILMNDIQQNILEIIKQRSEANQKNN